MNQRTHHRRQKYQRGATEKQAAALAATTTGGTDRRPLVQPAAASSARLEIVSNPLCHQAPTTPSNGAKNIQTYCDGQLNNRNMFHVTLNYD